VVFEATERAGGQILLAARSPRRRELLGIVEWRLARLAEHGAELRFGVLAEADDVMREAPEIVFVATGGVPNLEALETGAELAVSTWDVLSGQAAPGRNVLVFDDNGAHPGMQAAEFLTEAGAAVEMVTPERFFAPEIGGLNHAAYARVFHRRGVTVTINTRLVSIRRAGNTLRATLGSDYGGGRIEKEYDQVVIEHGTLPVDSLYRALRPFSINDGEVDYPALLAGRPQTLVRNPAGAFRLFRIGDAVASRNIHAAIFDGLRFAKDL
jgi:hypothetical protein